jgi:two-component system invasion response regulator UvrY
MIKVVVVDDHAVVREGLKKIIASNPEMVVTGEAADAREAVNVIHASPCDVVVLDISMPHTNGFDLLKQISTETPELPILVLSMHAADQYAARAFHAGSAGYVTKDSAPFTLVKAIMDVAEGKKNVVEPSRDLPEASGFPPLGTARDRLSGREYQVLCMLASGRTPTEIASSLTLSVKTISTYRARLLAKLSMRNNAELVRFAIKEKLVD